MSDGTCQKPRGLSAERTARLAHASLISAVFVVFVSAIHSVKCCRPLVKSGRPVLGVVPSQDPTTLTWTLAASQTNPGQTEGEKAREREELAYEPGPQVWHPAGLAETQLKMAECIPSPGKTNGTVVWVQRSWPSERTRRVGGGGPGGPDRDRRGHWSRAAGPHGSHHSHQQRLAASSCSQRGGLGRGGRAGWRGRAQWTSQFKYK